MIITIGREHGSNGYLIASGLAEELGLACYGKEIVDRAAQLLLEGGLSPGDRVTAVCAGTDIRLFKS